MVTVLLLFRKNYINFSILLSTLQSQLSPEDDIYIVDSSPDRQALTLAKVYGTTRCYIFVEPASIEHSLEYGLQSMAENDQQALIFLDENCFISLTFIMNMKQAINSNYEIVSPVVKQNEYEKMDNDFKFFKSRQMSLTDAEDFNSKCFMINKDKDTGIYGLLKNEFVSVLKPIPAYIK